MLLSSNYEKKTLKIDRQADRQTDRQIDRPISSWSTISDFEGGGGGRRAQRDVHSLLLTRNATENRQADRQAGKQTDRQTDRQV